MEKVEGIVRDIKSLRIQGATNVARAGIRAYLLRPTAATKKKLIAARPTEPLLFNALEHIESLGAAEVKAHVRESFNRIAAHAYPELKTFKTVFTHCHSSTVVKAILSAHIKKVVNTETRPLFQGRKTARELAKAGVKVTTFVDSAMHEALDNADAVVLGADALLKKGVINKVGSKAIAELAYNHNKLVFILADSWKYFSKHITIEERDVREVWNKAPKGVTVRNPAFEIIPKRFVTKIITENGVFSYNEFLKNK